MKRVVLNIHERQEEEDYQGDYLSSGRSNHLVLVALVLIIVSST